MNKTFLPEPSARHASLPVRASSWRRNLSRLLFAAVFFVGGFFVGAWKINKISPSQVARQIVATSPTFSDASRDGSVDFTLFWDVWSEVKKSYLKQPVDEKQLFYGAVAGIVNSLHDPYSVFFTPEETKQFESDLAGNFEGIGAEIGMQGDQLIVVSPLEGSPAQQAGLLAGDAILSIDGKDTFDMNVSEAVSHIRGQKGTTVVLNIFRKDEKTPRDVTITRDVIHINSVTWTRDDTTGIVHLKLNQFIDTTDQEMNDAVQKILLSQPKGIILDLRNNPGGYLVTAINVASRFIDKGVIVSEKFSDGQKKDYDTTLQPSFSGIPLVVLVNGGSASASEIVAGALQDYTRGKIIGEKTFGKGIVQNFQTLSDGSTLKITVAEWLTPKGRAIHGHGIDPDVVVTRTADDVENKRDPQFDKANELLLESIQK